MIVGPVFHFELLGLSRRRRYLLARVLYGVILLILMGTCHSNAFPYYTEPSLNMQAQFAQSFFHAFSWVQLAAVLALTPAMLSGTIAGEHERRTIDYLLTTSLNDTEISLGKFAARLLAIGAQLAVGFPILAIIMSLGGIDPQALLASFTVALTTLASLGALALAVSTRSRTSRDAVTRCYLILIAALSVPGLVWLIISRWQVFLEADSVLHTMIDWVMWGLWPLVEINPVYYLFMTLLDSALQPTSLTIFAACHLGAAAVLTIAAVFGLRRFYMRQAGKTENTKKSRTRRDRPIGERPMWWKERVTGRSGIKLGWFGKLSAFGLYALAVYGIVRAFLDSLEQQQSPMNSPFQMPTPIEMFAIIGVPSIACLATLLATARTAGSVTAERERDTWLTLLSTPLEPYEIIRAKLAGAIYSVRYWYWLIFLTWGLCLVMRPAMSVLMPFVAAAHVVMITSAAMLGLLCSLVSKTSLRAMGTALGVIVLGAWIGPAFFTGVIRGPAFLGFSQPISLGIVQGMATDFADGRGSPGDWDDGVVAMTIVAGLMYAIIAAVLYRQCVDRFDEFNGRVVERGRLPHGSLGASRAELDAQRASQLPLEVGGEANGVDVNGDAAANDDR